MVISSHKSLSQSELSAQGLLDVRLGRSSIFLLHMVVVLGVVVGIILTRVAHFKGARGLQKLEIISHTLGWVKQPLLYIDLWNDVANHPVENLTSLLSSPPRATLDSLVLLFMGVRD